MHDAVDVGRAHELIAICQRSYSRERICFIFNAGSLTAKDCNFLGAAKTWTLRSLS